MSGNFTRTGSKQMGSTFSKIDVLAQMQNNNTVLPDTKIASPAHEAPNQPMDNPKATVVFNQEEFPKNARKLMIIYTGGTLGMELINGKLKVGVKAMEHKLKRVKSFFDAEYTFYHSKGWMITPSINGKRLWYQVHQLKNLIDSNDTDADFYTEVAETIERFYHSYDAFLVIFYFEKPNPGYPWDRHYGIHRECAIIHADESPQVRDHHWIPITVVRRKK
jgi:hypothetical protein